MVNVSDNFNKTGKKGFVCFFNIASHNENKTTTTISLAMDEKSIYYSFYSAVYLYHTVEMDKSPNNGYAIS